MSEEWRPIPSEPLYEASSLGRVRNGNTGRVLATWGQRGYRTISLNTKPRGRHKCYVHRLIAEVFLGPCPAGKEVCHGNGVRWDNRADNLRYGTRKENVADTRAHGRTPLGERHKNSILTAVQVGEIRVLYALGDVTQAELGRQFGVARTTVQAIVEGRHWAHLLDEYANGEYEKATVA